MKNQRSTERSTELGFGPRVKNQQSTGHDADKPCVFTRVRILGKCVSLPSLPCARKHARTHARSYFEMCCGHQPAWLPVIARVPFSQRIRDGGLAENRCCFQARLELRSTKLLQRASNRRRVKLLDDISLLRGKARHAA